MATDQPQDQEERIRAVLHLPLGNINQAKAVRDVVAYIKGLRERPEKGVTGFTYSSSTPFAFKGYWCNAEGVWIADYIVICTIDFISSGDQEYALWDDLAELKSFVFEAYKRNASEQDEIWLVTHPIRRQLN